MRKFLIIVFVVTTIACKSKREKEIIRNLTNNDHKYWYNYEYYPDLEKPIRNEVCYFNNGKKTKVRFDSIQMKRYLYDPYNKLAEDIEVKYLGEWKLLDDSTLLFARSSKRHILLINDSIFSYILRFITIFKFPFFLIHSLLLNFHQLSTIIYQC